MNITLSIAIAAIVMAFVAIIYAVLVNLNFKKVKVQLDHLTEQVQRETNEVVICRYCGSSKGVMEKVCPSCKK